MTTNRTSKAIDRYMNARERMTHNSVPIPPTILRGYLDALRIIRSLETGEYAAKRIVITGQWLNGPRQSYARALFEQAISEGFVLDSQGQKWNGI